MNFLSELTGSFSIPCADNPTVAMVEAAYQHHGLDWRYINCEVPPEHLADAVRGAVAMGWRGFNCSLPHKVSVIQYLDDMGESASIMEAVNCVVIDEGKLTGQNTDGKGFVESLQERTDPAGKHMVIIGGGGAARAIGVETALTGASRITIVNRSSERGQKLAALLNEKTSATATFRQWDGPISIPEDVQIVVNATSIGLGDPDEQLDLDWDSVRSDLVMADVIPNPPKTHFVREAGERGCIVIDGLGMLVNQGVIGVKFWTGHDVDPAVMRAKLEEIFGV